MFLIAHHEIIEIYPVILPFPLFSACSGNNTECANCCLYLCFKSAAGAPAQRGRDAASFIVAYFPREGCACLFALSFRFNLSRALYVCVLFSFSSASPFSYNEGPALGSIVRFWLSAQVYISPFDIGRCCNTEGCCVCECWMRRLSIVASFGHDCATRIETFYETGPIDWKSMQCAHSRASYFVKTRKGLMEWINLCLV